MIATLTTSASAGTLQTIASEHLGYVPGVTQGRESSISEVTDNRYGSPALRAVRDHLRRSSHRATITVGKG